jgi:hypothetical protein
MQPDETITLSDATVSVYRKGVRLNDQECDRMTVQHFTGSEDNVFIYDQPNGQRRVARIRMVMDLQAGSSPAIPLSSNIRNAPEPISDDAEEQRLLLLYDKFATKK